MDLDRISLAITLFAFYLAWTAYRKDREEKRLAQKAEKGDILESIAAELGFMSNWLGTSYGTGSLNGRTWIPFSMVYGLSRNEAIKNAISGRSVTLLSRELLLLLVKFNQLLSNFEQHVNRAVLLTSSDPRLALKATRILDRMSDKKSRWKYIQMLFKRYSGNKPLKAEEEMLIATQMVMRDIHRWGIGSSDNPSSLHHVFKELRSSVARELEKLEDDPKWGEPRWQQVLDLIFRIALILILGALFLPSLVDLFLQFIVAWSDNSLRNLAVNLSNFLHLVTRIFYRL